MGKSQLILFEIINELTLPNSFFKSLIDLLDRRIHPRKSRIFSSRKDFSALESALTNLLEPLTVAFQPAFP